MLVHESCLLLFMVHKAMSVCFLFGEATNWFPDLIMTPVKLVTYYLFDIMFDKNA